MGKSLRLGDHCSKVGSGATPRGGKENYLEHGPYRLVRSQNIYNHGFEFAGIAYISKEQADKLSYVELHPQDVLVNITGDSVARACQIHEEALPARVNQHVAIVRPYPDIIDPTYLRYWFVAPSTQAQLMGLASAGATRNALTKSMLEGLEIPAFSIETQTVIANVLSALDDKIELNRRTNETLEAMAQAVFKDWFVDFGPVRRKLAGETDPQAILGGLIKNKPEATRLADLFPDKLSDNGLPGGWSYSPVHDLADYVNGAAYKKMHFVEAGQGLPVVKIAELKSGITKQTKFTNTDLGDKFRITTSDLLFSWSGNPDTSIDAFIWMGGDGWLNQHIFAVRENGRRSKPHLFFLLKSLMPQFAEIARDKQTTGLGHVTRGDMKMLEVCDAPADVLEAFDVICAPVFEKMLTNLSENQTLAETRDYLLPKLMSGQIHAGDAGVA